MNLKLIEVWDGENYTAIISALINHNTELRIRISGKKLIVKDPRSGFYACIQKGDPIEVPDEKFIEDDEPLVQEEEVPKFVNTQMTEDQKEMYQRWGLLK